MAACAASYAVDEKLKYMAIEKRVEAARADLTRISLKSDDADAALRAVLERFDFWDFYDQVGQQRAHLGLPGDGPRLLLRARW